MVDGLFGLAPDAVHDDLGTAPAEREGQLVVAHVRHNEAQGIASVLSGFFNGLRPDLCRQFGLAPRAFSFAATV